MAAFAVVCGATLAAQQQPSDLQIFEDGQWQTISTFTLLDIPIAGGVRQSMAVPSDVVTNASAGQGRLFVLVLDDLNTHPLRGVTVRELAKYFVDHNLEDGDRLALITTGGSREVTHEFTANRERLHGAIDRFKGHSLIPTDQYDQKQVFLDAQSTLRSLKAVSAWLGALPGRRKAIVFISEGIKFDIWNENLNPAGVMNPDTATIVEEMRDLVTAATRANVSIYPVDARGLPTAPAPTIKPIPTLVDEDAFRPDGSRPNRACTSSPKSQVAWRSSIRTRSPRHSTGSSKRRAPTTCLDTRRRTPGATAASGGSKSAPAGRD